MADSDVVTTMPIPSCLLLPLLLAVSIAACGGASGSAPRPVEPARTSSDLAHEGVSLDPPARRGGSAAREGEDEDDDDAGVGIDRDVGDTTSGDDGAGDRAERGAEDLAGAEVGDDPGAEADEIGDFADDSDPED